MGQGDLIGIPDASAPHLGVVVGIQGQRLEVAVGFGSKRLRLSAKSVEALVACPPGLSAWPQRLGDAPWNLTQQALVAASPRPGDIATAWLLLVGNPSPLPFSEWIQLLWADPSPAQIAAGWGWLKGEQLWFTCRHGAIRARPLTELRSLRQQRRHQVLQGQQLEQWHGLLRARQPLDSGSLSPDQSQQLQRLRHWAEGNSEIPLPQPLLQALRQAHCEPVPAAIRQLLVDLGQWDPHRLPALGNSPWSQAFNSDLETQAQALLTAVQQTLPGDERRIDRTGLRCFSIDDEDTEDIDDALGLQRLDGGLRLWIHVADPGRLIAAGDPLDAEALRRGASLYLARGIEPMFPWELSTQGLSLQAHHRCAAWSLWVELAPDGSLARYGIERTWIQPTYRLSYSDADELIELAPPQEDDLLQLHQLLLLRRRWRAGQGALLLDQPEGRVQSRNGDLTVQVCEPTASRLMVAEAMILAGAVVAQHGRINNLALPYRCQGPSALPPAAQLQQYPPGPVRHAAIKQGLSRGLTATSPSSHFSLGLEAYVQATSPIRRYGDLIVQRQLACLWEGRPPLSAAELQDLLTPLEISVKQGIQISRDDQRHWRQVWFAEHRQEQWRAQFLRWLRQGDLLGLVWLESLAMELPAHCPSDCEPADALLVKVHRVDPLADCLQLRAHH